VSLGRRAIEAVIHIGRRLFRNTPIQQLPIVTKIYRALFDRLHAPGTDLVVHYLGAEFVVPTGDVTVVPSLIAGDYERAEFEALERRLHRGMTVVDVGANIGLHTVFLASRVSPGGRVLALEPEPANFGYLEANVQRNGLTNVELFMVGAGARGGTLRLHLVPGTVGGHTAAEIDGGSSIDVEVVRLDDLLRDKVTRIDLMKLDVEGYEAQVLDGFRETLARDRPLLLIEFSPPLLRRCGTRPEELLATLQSIYPEILLFDDAGRPPDRVDARVSQALLAVTTGSRNLLCIP
jgi:FkbM family methyltransferase